MMPTSLAACALLESTVLVLQMIGILGLFAWRLLPSRRLADAGRWSLIAALLGLAFTGAALGPHDSEFALFAGGTITVLLIGMTYGAGGHEGAPPARPSLAMESKLAA